MVLVRMGQDNADEVVAALLDEFEVGKDQSTPGYSGR
jgi:hypothetical protein